MRKINTTGGQALLIAMIFFLFASMTAILGFARPVIKQIAFASNLQDSVSSIYLTEGLTEDLVYRMKNSLSIDSSETLTIGSNSANATITSVGGNQEIEIIANVDGAVRKQKIDLQVGIGVAFNFGVHAGEGGVLFTNSGGSIAGNLFSNGPVVGQNNFIDGEVIAAGPNGLVDDIHASSSIFSHTIKNSQIDKDAYYQVISNTLVNGNSYPGSEDLATSTLPITDEMVDAWKADALAGGLTDCASQGTFIIDSDVTIGPQKYNCDVTIKKNNTNVVLGGSIWVEGDIIFENAPLISIHPSLGDESVVIVADNPSDSQNSGNILVKNNTEFAGNTGTFVLLLSQNDSAENGGGNNAIDIDNNILGDVLVYAGHGTIEMENNANLKEVTGYKIIIKNNAQVIYDTGLASLLFTSGPGGGYEIQSWDEIE